MYKEMLDKLLDELAIRYHPVEGTTWMCEASGEPYRTLALQFDGSFEKPEGHAAALFESEELAWRVWHLAFTDLLKDRHGLIHWRSRPTLSTFEGKFFVWARVWIDSLPVDQPASQPALNA